MFLFDIMKEMTKLSEKFKEFIIANQDNPFFWVGAFCLGLAIFAFTYNALQKEK